MKMAHIQSLLELSQNFNSSEIVHSFSIGRENHLQVKFLKEDHVFEVTSTNDLKVNHYSSIKQAADALYEEIQSKNSN